MIQSVKVKNLSLSKDNVRKRNRNVGLEELAESIDKNGLLQNLVVTPLKKAGTFTIKAGGRRFRAILLLIEWGRLPADYEVAVLVLANDNAASVGASLAENCQRLPMNPADECLAFKTLYDQPARGPGASLRLFSHAKKVIAAPPRPCRAPVERG